MLQLRLEQSPAGGDVLLPALPLEPLADLVPGLVALGDLEPVPAGALGRLGGEHLHNVAVFQVGVIGHHPPVHPGPHHAVAHSRVDVVGKIDGGGSGGQALDVPVGGKDEHLVGEHIHLQGADKFLRVGVLLALQQLADPFKVHLAAQLLVCHPLLVLPVGRDAVLRGLVHLPGSDLHLEGNALPADDRGMEGLVHIRLGRADVVLEPPQHRLEHIVNTAQHVVALRDVIHDHPEGVQVENLVQRLVLGKHFPVDGVGMLHPAVHLAPDPLLFHPLLDAQLDGGQELLMGGGAGGHLLLDLLVSHGVQIAQREVLQFPFQLLHT